MAEGQLEWAVLMGDPGRRQEIVKEQESLRDQEAVALSEWMRTHMRG